jgi:predicted nucleic acid-binding protein
MKVDPALLPTNALIDTGVFMRFLGDRPDEAVSKECVAFGDAMVNNGRTLYVAAPTIAEVTRYQGKAIPRRKGIVVIPFDDRAAELLGLNMPMAKIHQAAQASGTSKTYMKYDALIAACALRAKAAMIVAIDSDHITMAKALNIPVSPPGAFEDRQPSLFDFIARLPQQD